MEQTIKLIHVQKDELVETITQIVRAENQQLSKNFQPKEPTQLLSRNETRDLLQIDLSTLYHWTRRGRLKSYGIAGRVYYKRDEVLEALELIK